MPARFSRLAWNPFLRFPGASLLGTALLCVPLLLPLADFQVSSESRVLLEGDQRNLSSYENAKRILADVEVLVISLECPEVFSPAGLDAVRRVSEAFERQPGVEEVKSLTHATKPVRRGLAFNMVPLVPREKPTTAELAALKKFALEHPLMRNVMVAGDSRHTLILVTYRRNLATPESQGAVRGEIESILAPFRREGLRFQTLALPLIEEEVRSTLRRDIRLLVPTAVALLAIILWLTFRSPGVLGLVLINQLAVLLILPGAIQVSGFSLNVFSVMLIPLLVGVQLTLLAHVFSAFQRAQVRGEANPVETMLREVFKACAFAAITTIIGLLSLALSEVQQVRDFGLLGAMGVSLVFGMTFGPGLALLKMVSIRWRLGSSKFRVSGSKFPQAGHAGSEELSSAHSESETRNPDFPRASEWLTRLVQQRRNVIMTLTGVAVVITAFGVGRIRTDIRAVEFLDPKSPTRQAVEELDRTYGGINVVQIEIDSGADQGINHLSFLQYLESVQRYAASRPEVSGAYSYAQLMAMMNQIWEKERPGSFQLPDNPLLLNLFILALKSQNFPFLTALSDPPFRTAYLIVRTRDMPSEQYLALLEDITRCAQKTKPEGVTVSAARGLHSILEADRRILRSQVSTAGVTVGVIALVLAFLWRSPLLALLAVLVNLIPVALVVAVAGYARVPLNSITIMVAAISLGIAVDDSVHFITQWREEYRRGLSARQAVRRALQVKGWPILWTSVIMIAIFGVFWLSSFPPVVHFGLLSATAAAGALLAVLFCLPSMLCLFPDRPSATSASETVNNPSASQTGAEAGD